MPTAAELINAHTPGALHVVADGSNGAAPRGCEIVLDDAPYGNPERDYFLVSVVHGDPEVLEANARRIVGAWNALQGVPLAVIEAGASGGLPWNVGDQLSQAVLMGRMRDLLRKVSLLTDEGDDQMKGCVYLDHGRGLVRAKGSMLQLIQEAREIVGKVPT